MAEQTKVKTAGKPANQIKEGKTGLKVARRYTKPNESVWDTVEWEKRTAIISNEHGEVVFEQKDVEIPSGWSMLATNVVVSKYFRGKVGGPNREHSVKQLIGRVVDTFTSWGWDDAYFASEADRDAFHDELTWILLHQFAAFNSPVWFNVGVEEVPQCSACFINSVEDSMEGILDLAKREGMLFKHGSGTGTNLSPLRSSREGLHTGGSASGPVSFMKGYDAFAGVIKSGGKTRRAAKMVILNADHPDIMEFVQCKVKEEKKAWALIDSGYDGSFTGEAYASVFFQNSNNSVRVTDEFMRAVVDDKDFSTRAVVDGSIQDTFKARHLMREMAESAWVCGDPGIQYDTTVNDWHPCSNTDRIHASNPCSEYMFLNDSACNLASLNLMKFRNPDKNLDFDVQSFIHTSEIVILAQEIIIDRASYPSKTIERNSYDYRPLGIGYANLGCLLMSRGLAYDSAEGRAYSAAITALLSGASYRKSSEVAKNHGPFSGYNANREPFLEVINKHRVAVNDIDPTAVPKEMLASAKQLWDDCLSSGQQWGFKNAQISVLAPTGTIGFMMDCDTTGVEPDIALVKYKKLVGGGMLKIVNQTVPEALKRLGYRPDQVKRIVEFIDENETIEGAPDMKDEHLSVFDCAFKAISGTRTIDWMGHIRMMAAVQPFISGAISKTVNMPNDSTVEDIMQAYTEAWKLGLKALAIYRDGSKRSQPLNTSLDGLKNTTGKANEAGAVAPAPQGPIRKRLSDTRTAVTHKFSIAGHEGYLTVGLYEHGMPGEIFITMAKEGSVVSGLVDSIATLTSISLQYGVPIEVLCNKFAHTRFEPSGFTNNPQIPIAKSIMDYVFRWLQQRFVNNAPVPNSEETNSSDLPSSGLASEIKDHSSPSMDLNDAPVTAPSRSKVMTNEQAVFQQQADAPPCHACGEIMIRSGACYKCVNCGETSGCS